MILTTTDHIEGKTITEYLGLVSAVHIAVLPGGHKMMGRGMKQQTQELISFLKSEASELDADAVVGIKYATLGSNHVLMGTAVKLT